MEIQIFAICNTCKPYPPFPDWGGSTIRVDMLSALWSILPADYFLFEFHWARKRLPRIHKRCSGTRGRDLLIGSLITKEHGALCTTERHFIRATWRWIWLDVEATRVQVQSCTCKAGDTIRLDS